MLNKEKLAAEISYLLDLAPGSRTNIRTSRGYKLVTLIIKIIVDALARGEEINIAGFGTFKPYQSNKVVNKLAWSFDGSQWTKKTTIVTQRQQVKKKIVFKPSKALTRYINGT